MAKQTFTTGQVLTAAQMTALQLNDYNQTVSAKVASYTLVASDAGTRITMSNASATTITVNTSLFAAGDTLFISNIGAGVCTITAGTATVSTASSLALAQYDSGSLYFTSAGVAIWQKYAGASSGASFVGAIATRNANLSVANSTAVAITLPDELKDTNGFHAASASSFVIPSGYAGVYQFTGSFSLDGLAANTAMIRWYLNGSLITAGTTGLVAGITNTTTGPYGNLGYLMLNLSVADSVEAFAYQSGGSTVNLTNARISMSYLGA